MGWQDYHLHEFEANGIAYVMVDPEGDGLGKEIDPTEWSYGRPARYAEDVRLGQVARGRGAHLVYTYDFGDEWIHDIIVEDIEPVERDVEYPICLAGERSCPREDAGGIIGYEEMLEVLRDPDHEEYESTRMWLGDDFDPEDFDLVTTNRALLSGYPPTVWSRTARPSRR